MKKRDELLDPSSCLSKAGGEEWIFVLLQRDPAAPTAIRAWIAERIKLGLNTPTDAKIREAEEWIRQVEATREKPPCST